MTLDEFYYICDEIVPAENGCKNWPLVLSCWGYSRATIDGKDCRGNRVALERKLGRAIQPGRLACHSCNNKACVEMNHLYEGTSKQNTQDIINSGGFPTGDDHHTRGDNPIVQLGSKNGNAKLTEELVKEIRLMYANGKSNEEIAPLFRVTPACIHNVTARNTWKHVT